MKNNVTLAIYGIKDRFENKYPAYTHDHNVCLMQNGRILQYLQLERYTRRKYDNRLDIFLEELIDSKLLDLPENFDLVSVNSFVGNCFISKNGKIRFEADRKPYLNETLEKAFAYYQFKDWEGKELNAYNCPQELAHIGSCLPFFGDFKENSLLIHFDGASSVSNFSAFCFKNGKLELIEYGWNMKYIANFFNDNALNFKIIGVKPDEHCSLPGKLMGYACLGNYNKKIETWLKANAYFKEYWEDLSSILDSIKPNFDLSFQDFNNEEIFFQDVAATFQSIFEREILNKIESIQNKIKADYLYYSGGCALNIIANTKIIEKHLFKDVYIPPCCNDSGLSIGAAAFHQWQQGIPIVKHKPYLNNIGLEENCINISKDTIIQTVSVLINKGIIGVCNGDGEAGPRALGNRSLIALAHDKELAQKLSMIVKKREWYRPVAPIMLTSNAEKVVGKPLHHLSKFMLLDFNIKEEFYPDLAGVIHANKTARIQTITDEKDNPFMYQLLKYLFEEYGALALINTSFNIQGEPIIHHHHSAFESAKQMNLDAVVINHQFYKL